MAFDKDQSIEDLVQTLRAALGSDSFQVVDHWDADLHAIGIAACHDSRRLVYISTCDEPPGRYYFECETPGNDDNGGHQVVRTEEHATFDVLLQAIHDHLAHSAP